MRFGLKVNPGTWEEATRSRDAFARLLDRYREIGFDEVVCYAPKADERAVFDEVVSDLDAWR